MIHNLLLSKAADIIAPAAHAAFKFCWKCGLSSNLEERTPHSNSEDAKTKY